MIRCQCITKSFGELQVLAQLEWEIGTSGIYGITGPSGCGKTTLARLILGLESPDSGEIVLPKEYRFAVMFPEDRLLPQLSAFENVRLVCDDEMKIKNLFAELEITTSNQAVQTFSSGMKRRVALIRALCFPADGLLLDEPFKGLDRNMKKKMTSLIQAASQEMPVLLIDHDIALLEQICTQILYLKKP